METNNNTIRISSLESVRGITSLIIVIFHVYGIHRLDISPSLLFYIKHFGQGVTLFFIISSFSIFLNYYNKIDTLESVKRFYINRFARITPLFIFMLLFYVMMIKYLTGNFFSFNELFINVLHIFALFPGKHCGIIWASWAIGVLFTFYFIAPILLITIRNIKYSIILIIVTVIIGNYAKEIFCGFNQAELYCQLNYLVKFPAFSFGILTFFCYYKFGINKNSKLLIAFLTAVIMIILLLPVVLNSDSLLKIEFLKKGIKDNSYVIWCMVGSMILFYLSIYKIPLFDNLLNRFLGKISYSTYLIHPVAVYFLKTIYYKIYTIENLNKDIAFSVCCILSIFIVIPLAYISEKFIEVPGKNFIKKIGNKKILIND